MNWNDYPNFSESEFRCHCGCGKADIQPDFMEMLQTIRTLVALPMTITSGYRCEDHNRSLKGGPEHPTGWAADIGVANPDALKIIKAALHVGFPRIGVSQRSGRPRFIHLGGSPDLPSAIWSY